MILLLIGGSIAEMIGRKPTLIIGQSGIVTSGVVGPCIACVLLGPETSFYLQGHLRLGGVDFLLTGVCKQRLTDPFFF